MIYLVTECELLFTSYKRISIEESLELLNTFDNIQINISHSSLNVDKNNLLAVSLSNKKQDINIIIDCKTIDLSRYKEIIESKFIIGMDLTYIFTWFYQFKILPKRVYDVFKVSNIINSNPSFEDNIGCFADNYYLEDRMNHQIKYCKENGLFETIRQACKNIQLDVLRKWNKMYIESYEWL